MSIVIEAGFADPDLLHVLEGADPGTLDSLGFGVIGFDRGGVVRRYNAIEVRGSGVSAPKNIGQSLFTAVAPCMNNYLVAQRFDDAVEKGILLDATIDYVLTLRMRPTKVKLRLLASPDAALQYVLIRRIP